MTKLAKNLKKIRKQHNLSQEQLADELGVSRQAISKWESSAAYPEMEKIVQICQKFKVNIDDLLNQDLDDTSHSSQQAFTSFIDHTLHSITNTFNLLCGMSLKERVKCLFEQILIIAILVLISYLVGNLISSILTTILSCFLPPAPVTAILQIFSSLYLAFACVASVIIFTHIFKKRYLDYYHEVAPSVPSSSTLASSPALTSSPQPSDRPTHLPRPQIIINRSEHDKSALTRHLSKILIILAKIITGLIVAFLSFFFICSLGSIIFSFTISGTGIFFIGILLGAVSLSVFLFCLILPLVNFILSRTSHKKPLLYSAIISIIIFGLSCGLACLGSLDFHITDAPSDLFSRTASLSVPMSDNLIIRAAVAPTYVERDIDDIQIEYRLNEACTFKQDTYSHLGKNFLHIWGHCSDALAFVRQTLDGLNHHRVINTSGELSDIKIYASAAHLKKLQTNLEEYEQAHNDILLREQTYSERIHSLETSLRQCQTSRQQDYSSL